METRVISDGQISASSQWDPNHAAIQGRLHFQAGGGKAGGWSARSNDANQWLQVDLGSEFTKVTGVATQGRNAFNQWVTKYKLEYSKDGVHFQYYREQGRNENKVKRTFSKTCSSKTIFIVKIYLDRLSTLKRITFSCDGPVFHFAIWLK